MRPKASYTEPDLFKKRLDQIINLKHPLAILAQKIDWSFFEQKFGDSYSDSTGRPAIAIQVMVGLHYIKYSYSESDESVLFKFIENPYWQYFCGYEYFQHNLPIDPSSMTRFRKRVGSEKLEHLLEELINTMVRGGQLTASHFEHVNIDTTVQEKAIAFPTDSRLYYEMREKLVSYAEKHSIVLRQNYRRVSRKMLSKTGRYAHGKQYRKSGKTTKKLKNYLGCVYRDMMRQCGTRDAELNDLLAKACVLLEQEKDSKNKLYSIHAPEVDCISKGKSHKRYEFGSKVGVATTSKDNWIIGTITFHGNPYDGHTLASTIKKAEQLSKWKMKNVYVDLGYRGHDYHGDSTIHIVNSRKFKKLSQAIKRWYKRRSAIEPVIGHMKSDNNLNRNRLKGKEGDRINAIMSACGFNMRKLLAVFFLPKIVWDNIKEILTYLGCSNKTNFTYAR